MASAISSLPVPVSPLITTVASVGATTLTMSRASRSPWLAPTICGKPVSNGSPSLAARSRRRGRLPQLVGTGVFCRSMDMVAAYALIVCDSFRLRNRTVEQVPPAGQPQIEVLFAHHMEIEGDTTFEEGKDNPRDI